MFKMKLKKTIALLICLSIITSTSFLQIFLISGNAASISSIIKSNDGKSIYKAGDQIDFNVNYDESVNVNLPLDRVTGAVAAYSLRLLKSDYTGNAIKARRTLENSTATDGSSTITVTDSSGLEVGMSIDGTGIPPNTTVLTINDTTITISNNANATGNVSLNFYKDIGFSNGEFDTSSLSMFANGSSVFVHTWYDQSGIGNHLTQSNVIYQPTVNVNGISNKPVLTFDDSGLVNLIPNMGSITDNFSIITTLRGNSNTFWDNWIRFGAGGPGDPVLFFTSGARGTGAPSGAFEFASDGHGYGSATTTNVMNSSAFIASATVSQEVGNENWYMWENGVPQYKSNNSAISAASLSEFRIGHYSAFNRNPNGDIGELIVINTGNSVLTDTNRQAIERNQGVFFGITTAYATKPLDSVGSAAAAYGLRKLRDAYTGSSIRVRATTYNRTANTTSGSSIVTNISTTSLRTGWYVTGTGIVDGTTITEIDTASNTITLSQNITATGTGVNLSFAKDIGFTADGELDVPTLMAFVQDGSGYVHTWYDQSVNSNGKHAVQTTVSNQPRIVNAGVLDMVNGKPQIMFDGSNDTLVNTLLSLGSFTGFTVAKVNPKPVQDPNNNNWARIWNLSDNANGYSICYQLAFSHSDTVTTSGSLRFMRRYPEPTSAQSFTSVSMSNLSQATVMRTKGSIISAWGSSNYEGFQSDNITTNTSRLNIGSHFINLSDYHFFSGNMGELIFYNSDLTDSDRIVVENSQMSYYNITGTTENTPTISMNLGEQTREATYVSGSGTSTHTYRYIVKPGDNDSDGISISSPINGGTNKNNLGNDAILAFALPDLSNLRIDTTKPVINSVTLPNNKTYKASDNLNFTVNFSENVIVTGTPKITLTIDNQTKYATYESGTGTSSLVFSYKIEEGLNDNDGIVMSSPISDGTIRDVGLNDADLSFTIPNTQNILVESIKPTLLSLVEDDIDNRLRTGDSVTITAEFSENMADTPTISITNSNVTNEAMVKQGGNSSIWEYTWTLPQLSYNKFGIVTVAGNDIAGNSYEGTETISFRINPRSEISGVAQNPTPLPTPSPSLSPTAMPRVIPTAIPTQTPTYTSIVTPTPITMPTPIVTLTPITIQTPIVTPTPLVTPTPVATSIPTGIPLITPSVAPTTNTKTTEEEIISKIQNEPQSTDHYKEYKELLNDKKKFEGIKVFVEGNLVDFSSYGEGIKPRILDGRTLLPIRAISDYMGFDIMWDSKRREVIVDDKDGNRLIFKINSKIVKLNDMNIEIDVSPIIINDRTFVPIRFIAEFFDKKVHWLENTTDIKHSEYAEYENITGIVALYSEKNDFSDSIESILQKIKTTPDKEENYFKYAKETERKNDKGIKIFIDGEFIDLKNKYNKEAEIIDGRTLIPSKAIEETFSLDNRLKNYIENNSENINNNDNKNIKMVSLRAICDILEKQIYWNNYSKDIKIIWVY